MYGKYCGECREGFFFWFGFNVLLCLGFVLSSTFLAGVFSSSLCWTGLGILHFHYHSRFWGWHRWQHSYPRSSALSRVDRAQGSYSSETTTYYLALRQHWGSTSIFFHFLLRRWRFFFFIRSYTFRGGTSCWTVHTRRASSICPPEGVFPSNIPLFADRRTTTLDAHRHHGRCHPCDPSWYRSAPAGAVGSLLFTGMLSSVSVNACPRLTHLPPSLAPKQRPPPSSSPSSSRPSLPSSSASFAPTIASSTPRERNTPIASMLLPRLRRACSVGSHPSPAHERKTSSKEWAWMQPSSCESAAC